MGQYPCRNCIYYKECGESTRTMPCKGRTTKSQQKGLKASLVTIDEFPLKTREELIREGEREQARRSFYED